MALEAVIADALALLAAGSDQGRIAIETRLDADAGIVLADNVQIQQVLMNLTRNACQAAAGAAAPRVVIASTAVEGNLKKTRR